MKNTMGIFYSVLATGKYVEAAKINGVSPGYARIAFARELKRISTDLYEEGVEKSKNLLLDKGVGVDVTPHLTWIKQNKSRILEEARKKEITVAKEAIDVLDGYITSVQKNYQLTDKQIIEHLGKVFGFTADVVSEH